MNKIKNMYRDWNSRALTNAYHWVFSSKKDWDKEEYYRQGDEDIERIVLPFLNKQGLTNDRIKELDVLDIGCGTGRLSRALAKHCKQVTGIDISDEMLKKAKEDNADINNIKFVLTNGSDLGAVDSNSLDFCFSYLVFQHIPRQSIIESYLNEIHRILKNDGVALLQFRGYPGNPPGKALWFMGFKKFYIAFCLYRKTLPILWIKKYGTVYGACFNQKQIKSILKKIGFTEVKTYMGNKKYLWTEIKK
ncbi:methyltransferase domain-containing protein [Patescibacteria group bacterium]|nr:methyltransferase domain-containing protein [Patescibacteria group bacterium]